MAASEEFIADSSGFVKSGGEAMQSSHQRGSPRQRRPKVMSISDSTSPTPPPPPPSTPTGEEEEKPSPYNMYVAFASLGGAVAVFLLVSAASCSSGLIKTPADFA